MPGRAFDVIVKQFYSNMVKVKPSAKVITIEPVQNALTMERVVKLFTTAFEQICALKVVDKLTVNSLTHELTAAEITAVFRGRELVERRIQNLNWEFIYNLGKSPEKIKGKPGERKDCLLIRASTEE